MARDPRIDESPVQITRTVGLVQSKRGTPARASISFTLDAVTGFDRKPAAPTSLVRSRQYFSSSPDTAMSVVFSKVGWVNT